MSIKKWYQDYGKEGVWMKMNKSIQKKFRIDANIEKALRKVLSNNNVTFQFVMESLLRDYICKNLDVIIKNDKQ